MKGLVLLATAAAISSVTAFTGTPLITKSRALVVRQPSSSYSRSNLYMGGASGFATTKEGKTKTIDRIKGLLDKSEMVFSVPATGFTVAELQKLRRSMPEGTTISVVKNTLMERAVQGTEYEAASSMLKGPNMWFFIQEDIGASIKTYTDEVKEMGKTEDNPLLGGVIEGGYVDGAKVDAIGDLPSKQDLYAQIAGAIKAVPTKVARVIKAPSQKLARAIKLVAEQKEEGGESSE